MSPLILALFFTGVTATYDGGTVYFTTSLRLKGENASSGSRIYAFSTGAFRRIDSLPDEDFRRVSVSEDGRTLVAHTTAGTSLLIRDGEATRLQGRAFLSRNGRFLLLRGEGGDTMRDLDSGQPVPIPAGTPIAFEPAVADDGRLSAGTPVCPETYLNPSATYAVDVCTRVITSGFMRFRTTCDAYLRDVAAGTSWKFAEDDCYARSPILSNEWLALRNEIISLREQKRIPRGNLFPQVLALTSDELSLIVLDPRGRLSRQDIRTGESTTLLAPIPLLSRDSAFLVPGSLLSLIGENIGGSGLEFATTAHRFPAQAYQDRIYGVVPNDIPLGETELRLLSPLESPFEQVPGRVPVLDWQPWPIFHPSLEYRPPKPGAVFTLYLTGLRTARVITAALHISVMNFTRPLADARYAPTPGVPGMFSVEVRLPEASQLPAPFPGTNSLPIQIEIGPAGPMGTARLGFDLPLQ